MKLPAESTAWLVPTIGCWIASKCETELSGVVGETRVICGYFLLGTLLGWAWYRLYPRSLAYRLTGMSVAACVLAMLWLLMSFVGGSVELSRAAPSTVMALGVLAGLALTEQHRPGNGRWLHQRRTALTSRGTLRSMR